MLLDKNNSFTDQIFEILLSRIMKSEYKNMKLPSQNELCDEFNVSRITIRKVFDKLYNMGLIETDRRRGTFIKENGSFKENVLDSCFKEPYKKHINSLILSVNENCIKKNIADYLHSNSIVNIKSARSIGKRKISYENSYINKDLFKNFDWKNDIKSDISLYDVFKEKFNISIGRIEENVLAVNPPKNICSFLNIKNSTPILLVKRTVYPANIEIPFEYSEIYIIAEFFGKIIYNSKNEQ